MGRKPEVGRLIGRTWALRICRFPVNCFGKKAITLIAVRSGVRGTRLKQRKLRAGQGTGGVAHRNHGLLVDQSFLTLSSQAFEDTAVQRPPRSEPPSSSKVPEAPMVVPPFWVPMCCWIWTAFVGPPESWCSRTVSQVGWTRRAAATCKA